MTQEACCPSIHLSIDVKQEKVFVCLFFVHLFPFLCIFPSAFGLPGKEFIFHEVRSFLTLVWAEGEGMSSSW